MNCGGKSNTAMCTCSSYFRLVVQLLTLVTIALSDTNADVCEMDKERVVLHIMAVVPTVTEKDYGRSSPSWKQGEELLQGAYLAASEAGESLSGYRIEIIPVRVPQCDFNNGIPVA